MRDQIGLSYLFARAADTIADTDLIGREQRLVHLYGLMAQFTADTVDWARVRGVQTALMPHQSHGAERVLLERLEDCFRVYQTFTTEDRQRIRALMNTLPKGMEMDLQRFPVASGRAMTALHTEEELDTYTYYVAGCVGEFWTKMTCAHRRALAHWDVDKMSAIGVRFGKGLQLTNIIKDLSRDLARGRCYIPETMLAESRLTPKDLLRQDSLPLLRPVLRRLLHTAVDHLDQGWLYTLAVPRREVRLRLACMWPLLLAGETLRRVAASPRALDPHAAIKVPRSRVYGMMALTTLTGACGYVGLAYWGWLRKQIV